MTESGVEFTDVSYTLPDGRELLHSVSLTLAPGTTTALLGRSGSGKTTLLRMVNALVRPSQGKVTVGGRDANAWDQLALRRSVGYVIQESGLFPHRRVADNVGMPLELAGEKDFGDKVAEAMQLVGLPAEEYGSRFPWQLSGGQRQRAGVARALVAGQSVLLMDEPLGALDPLTRAEMQDMLRGLLQRMPKTVLLVTHDLDEAVYLADRVVFVVEGRIAANLAADEVAASEIAAVKQYVAAVHRGAAGKSGGTRQ